MEQTPILKSGLQLPRLMYKLCSKFQPDFASSSPTAELLADVLRVFSIDLVKVVAEYSAFLPATSAASATLLY